MKKISIVTFFSIFAIGLFLFTEEFTTSINADTGAPVTISATYNSSTGQLNSSGTYEWEECEPGEETNILGFALFINNGTPVNNNSDALDGDGMHLVNNGDPCTVTPGQWVDNSHVLSQTPEKVCIVVYDVRADDSADPGGIHSLIGAGANYNTDNSWNYNNNSYSAISCTAPRVVTQSPAPTTTPTPVATVTPNADVCANLDGIQTSLPNDYHFDLTGKNCLQFSAPGAPTSPSVGGTQVLGVSTVARGQVLGTSTMAGTGVVEDALFNSIFTLGSLLTSFGIIKNSAKYKVHSTK